MPEIERFDIDGPLVVTPRAFDDDRGSFCVTYVDKDWAEVGVDVAFVQDNQSISVDRGVVRGMHFQAPPFAQDKLVRVVKGAVLDIIVDIREGSPTYGRHLAVELSAANRKQLFVPIGFAHGFVTLEPMTEVQYKVSAYYAPETEGGFLWSDPTLALPWPIADADGKLSGKDQKLPLFKDFETPFRAQPEGL